MKQHEMVNFWIESSDKDFIAMKHLFEKKDYSWSLFIGHLVIEKLLKAYFIKVKNEQPPFIHDLVRIAAKADLELTEEQKDILDTISTFNIRARYADYKQAFHKRCNREFSKIWLENIKEFSGWIKKKHLS